MGMILESLRNTVIAGCVLTAVVAFVAPMLAYDSGDAMNDAKKAVSGALNN